MTKVENVKDDTQTFEQPVQRYGAAATFLEAQTFGQPVQRYGAAVVFLKTI
jgi:hypothetical protein